jgi:hypothetical protein
MWSDSGRTAILAAALSRICDQSSVAAHSAIRPIRDVGHVQRTVAFGTRWCGHSDSPAVGTTKAFYVLDDREDFTDLRHLVVPRSFRPIERRGGATVISLRLVLRQEIPFDHFRSSGSPPHDHLALEVRFLERSAFLPRSEPNKSRKGAHIPIAPSRQAQLRDHDLCR